MKSFQMPGRHFCVVLLASSALSFVLSGCIESPTSFDPSSVTPSEASDDPHAGHGAATPEDPHAGHGGAVTTPTTPTAPTTPVSQSPAAAWTPATAQQSFSSQLTDRAMPISDLVVDKFGNQFLSWKLSSNLNSETQTFAINTVSVNVKPANSAQWSSNSPFNVSEGTIISDIQIVTDIPSGKTYALWQKASGEVYLSNYITDGTSPSWSTPEPINNLGTSNFLTINSHGMPVILGVNVVTGGFEFIYRNKMHDGMWAADIKLSRVLESSPTNLAEFAFALDANDLPMLMWNEQSSITANWQLHFAKLKVSNSWFEMPLSVSSVDLSKLKSISLVAASTNQNLEAILIMDSREVSSISAMAMDGGASYMWHTPVALIDSTVAAAITLAPSVVVNGAHAMLLWGDYMMVSNSTSTMTMTDTNMLKARSFLMDNTWGVTQSVAMATGNSLIKYVAPSMDDEGRQSISWIESDAAKGQLFVSNYVSKVWQPKEIISEVDLSNKNITMSLVNIDVSGKVNVLWLQEETAQAGNKTVSFVSSRTNSAIYEPQISGVVDGAGPGNTTNPGGTVTVDPVVTIPPDSNSNVTVSAVWGVPQTIWTNSIPITSSVQLKGPKVTVDNSGHAVIYLEKTPKFIPEINSFGSGEYIFYRHVEGSIWNQEKPLAPVGAPNAKLIRYQAVKNTGDVYALWSDNSKLYFSRYIPALAQWMPAEALNITPISSYLLVDEAGMVTLIWTSADIINNTTQVNAKHFMPETGWAPETHTSIASTAIPLDPVISNSGAVTMAWLTRAADHANPTMTNVHADLWAAEIDPITGWSTHTKGIHVPEFGFSVNKIYNLNSTMKLATFYNFLSKSLSVSVYMKNMGWSELVNPYQDGGSGKPVMSEPIVRANLSGAVIVAWKESVLESNGVTQEHYVSSTYSMGSGWSAPVIIAHEAKNSSDLDLVLDDSGHAIATWISTDSTMSMVHVNHYDSTIGWGMKPEMLAGYDLAKLERAMHPSVDINFAGQAVITWDHVMTKDGNEIHQIQEVNNF